MSALFFLFSSFHHLQHVDQVQDSDSQQEWMIQRGLQAATICMRRYTCGGGDKRRDLHAAIYMQRQSTPTQQQQEDEEQWSEWLLQKSIDVCLFQKRHERITVDVGCSRFGSSGFTTVYAADLDCCGSTSKTTRRTRESQMEHGTKRAFAYPPQMMDSSACGNSAMEDCDMIQQRVMKRRRYVGENATSEPSTF